MDPSHTLTHPEPSAPAATQGPQLQLLDFFFPGFSMFSSAIQKYLHIDLNVYVPLVLLLGGMTFAWQYFSEYFWRQLELHFMSTVDVRVDDEIYNMLMAWVAAQRFSKGARRFVVNTNLNSRSWYLWRYDYEDEDENEDVGVDETSAVLNEKAKKALAYTPTFGSHYFWYKGRLLIFRRSQNRDQASFLVVSEREEISISCFGRDPWVLKELLLEARAMYLKRDERKTLIYRGTTKAGSTEPSWQRCMARTARPFSTVILNEKKKKDIIDDVTDYLNPATRRWYSNRGIPYRRGYLLYGPPGTGKSSLSLALAGFFKMKIYIVSLSSVSASEENLASLFAELPRRCVVLLEDIDTAGLTHTREDNKAVAVGGGSDEDMSPNQVTKGAPASTPVAQPPGRLSLSGLLNILDGVASQEGRVLIMTTNHLEKLDKALIRPGRVDMIVEFGRADTEMTAAIFRAIFAPLEGDDPKRVAVLTKQADIEDAEKKAAEKTREMDEKRAKVEELSHKFAAKVPAHEFSPAELQGYLMKNKRDMDAAVAGIEEWVVVTRKEKKDKELQEAEDKRKAEEEEKKKKEEEEEEAKKKKKEEEKKKRKEAKKKSKKQSKRSKSQKDDDSSDSDSSASSESEAEAETKAEAKVSKDEDTTKKELTPDGDGKEAVEAKKEKASSDSGYGTP